MFKNTTESREVGQVNETEGPARRFSDAQIRLAVIIAAIGAGGALYRLLVRHRLEQTAALFIGLPTILAFIIALTPRAKSAVGVTLKGMTICLLLSGPLLGEGFICILMAAPLFYLVGIIIALLVDHDRKRQGIPLRAIALVPLLLTSLEGVSDRVSFPRGERLVIERTVRAGDAMVETRLATPPRFEKTLPVFLRLKFPRPVGACGEGLTLGARRTIHFAGGEGEPGDLVVEVSSRSPRQVTFSAVKDTSHIAHWLRWRKIQVTWHPQNDGSTRVRWDVAYERSLDPAWYFGPWERYAVGRATEYLSDALLER